ncbi:GntR family transcriptional regulator [Aquibacillus albus]|uniref:DNA-binding GntR family transcriptional regulator n=1 Tax=Aquibacillus albus TaxID=1168171 RepID=A0ABS2MW86_9BACI|nr:GntR family transcriptional regulator [Aquibacillus albus]MBM7570159.1 DNA-binding GntR family transcriptional regulator [Aquibacillus albus]
MSRKAGNGYLEKKAYNEIKKMILNNELKPDETIIQDQIAQKIGVSRTPLRRALAELERDYLVETTSNGIVVRRFSDEFLRSVWEVRAVLEGLSSRLATPLIDEPMISYFKTLFESAYRKWESGESEAYKKADEIFHRKLMEIAGNIVLHRSLESTQVLNIAFDLGLVRSPEETYTEHMDILEAMESRDADKAEKLMLEHIRNSTHLINVKYSIIKD